MLHEYRFYRSRKSRASGQGDPRFAPCPAGIGGDTKGDERQILTVDSERIGAMIIKGILMK